MYAVPFLKPCTTVMFFVDGEFYSYVHNCMIASSQNLYSLPLNFLVYKNMFHWSQLTNNYQLFMAN